MLKPVRWTPDLVSHFWDALTETKLLDIGFSKWLAGTCSKPSSGI